MPINKFIPWAKKFLSPDKSLDQAPRTEGEKPSPAFRETGKVPEDTSGFKGNIKPTFR